MLQIWHHEPHASTAPSQLTRATYGAYHHSLKHGTSSELLTVPRGGVEGAKHPATHSPIASPDCETQPRHTSLEQRATQPSQPSCGRFASAERAQSEQAFKTQQHTSHTDQPQALQVARHQLQLRSDSGVIRISLFSLYLACWPCTLRSKGICCVASPPPAFDQALQS
jgi:hypothetical protein